LCVWEEGVPGIRDINTELSQGVKERGVKLPDPIRWKVGKGDGSDENVGVVPLRVYIAEAKSACIDNLLGKGKVGTVRLPKGLSVGDMYWR
jgi:hypothetical protein